MTKLVSNLEQYKSILEQYQMSLFENSFSKFKLKDISLFELLNMTTKENDIFEKVKNIRFADSKEKADFIKSTLPAVTLSGTFSQRNSKSLTFHSGLLQIDIDNVENVQLIKDTLKHDSNVFVMFVSPSNNGLKCIVKIYGNKHLDYFKYYEKYFLETYNITIDKKCKDVSRLMYISHDKEIFVNPKAETIDLSKVEPIKKPTATKTPGAMPGTKQTISYPKNVVECWKFTEQKESYTQGNRNAFIMLYGSNCNRAGLNEIEVLQLALDNCTDLTETEIKATITSAYKNTSDHATKKYKPLADANNNLVSIPSVAENVESSNLSKSSKEDVKETNKLTEKEKLIANLYKQINDSEGKVKDVAIQYNGMIELMYFLGYRRFDIENEYIVVKIENNVLSQETPHIVQQNVFRFIDSLPTTLPKEVPKSMLFEKLRKSRDKLFNKGFFTMLLPDKEYNFNVDTSKEVFIYYQNGFVKVTATGVEFLDYKKLTGYIWKNQILKRDFKQIDNDKTGNFIFLKYLQNISNNNDLRLLSLKTLIGYLLHNFFDTKLKAVVFTDSSISDEPNGRTGKTLLGKALEKIKPTTIINGKTFNPDNQFRYQEITIDTQIIFLNDLKPKFDVETLFNDITEKVKIERKNQSPVSQYAKFLIATNRTLKIVNASAKDRFIEFEFSEYYNEKFSPLIEFKKMFFGHEFTKTDWHEFDNVICECIREYLESGILEAPVINLHKRKAIEETNNDFVSWFESLLENGFIANRQEYDKADLHNKFLNDYPDNRTNKYTSQQKTFSKFVNTFCRYSDTIKCSERKSNDKRFFTFNIVPNTIE